MTLEQLRRSLAKYGWMIRFYSDKYHLRLKGAKQDYVTCFSHKVMIERATELYTAIVHCIEQNLMKDDFKK